MSLQKRYLEALGEYLQRKKEGKIPNWKNFVYARMSKQDKEELHSALAEWYSDLQTQTQERFEGDE